MSQSGGIMYSLTPREIFLSCICGEVVKFIRVQSLQNLLI